MLRSMLLNRFNELVASLATVTVKLHTLCFLTLAFYLEFSYKRYNKFYWNCRKVQGAINNLALIVGTSCDPDIQSPALPKSKEEKLLTDFCNFERYLNLVHVLMYWKFSPVLEDPQVISGLEVLRDSEVLGYGAVDEKQKEVKYPNILSGIFILVLILFLTFQLVDL